MEKRSRVVFLSIILFFLLGCTDYEYVKIKAIEVAQRNDLNYDRLDLLVPWQDANVADNISVDWAGLQNYPVGCGSGFAVQVIGDTLTCTPVSGGSGGGDVYWYQLNSLVPWNDANVSDDLNLNTMQQTSLSDQLIVTKMDTNQIALNKRVDKQSTFQQELDVYGDINIRPVATPLMDLATLTVEYDASYALEPGQYSYSLGYETVDGNTPAGYGNTDNCQTVTITGQNGRVRIDNIPQPTDARVKKIIIYRGKKNTYATTCARDYPVVHLPIGTTTYTDNLPESSLPPYGTYRQDNSTVRGLYIQNNPVLKAGTYNTAFGFQAGNKLKTGSYENVLIGTYAGRDINTGHNNTVVGHQACPGIDTGSENICVGSSGTIAPKNALHNVLVGNYIGYYLPATGTMNYNVLVGRYALGGATGSTSATYNVVVGSHAGQYIANSSGNVLVGYYAGRASSSTISGTNNTIIGTQAGTDSISNSRNIIIGYDTEITDKSNALNIGNIIFGTGLTSVGGTAQAGNIGIGERNPTTKLDVNGDANVFGNLYVRSNVYAQGFITASKVENVKSETKSLKALDNAAEWINPDGSVNYDAHYAGTAYTVKKIVGYKIKTVVEKECRMVETEQLDEQLNPIEKEECENVEKQIQEPIYEEETKKGLDMEKRIATLEKMMYELRQCVIAAANLNEIKLCVN